MFSWKRSEEGGRRTTGRFKMNRKSTTYSGNVPVIFNANIQQDVISIVMCCPPSTLLLTVQNIIGLTEKKFENSGNEKCLVDG